MRRRVGLISSLVLGAAAILTVGSASLAGAEPSVGRIDHVRILVHDIAASRREYRDRLGFSFPDTEPYIYAEGSAHDGVDLPDDTDLELIGVADRAKLLDVRPWIVSFLEAQQGAHSVGLLVPSAQETSDQLQARGVSAPVFRLARANPQDPPVLLVTPKTHSLPDGAIFFLQYPPRRPGRPPPPPLLPQANTTQRLLAVWIVVKDLAGAADEMKSLGFDQPRSEHSRVLAANLRRYETGYGDIILFHASGKGPVARFAKARGDGVMGVTLAAADLPHARALIRRTTGRRLATYRGVYGASVLIPADLAAGAWIELAQK